MKQQRAVCRVGGWLGAFAALCLAWGCSDSEKAPIKEEENAQPSWYVIATAVSDTDGANTYIKAMSRLEGGELDLTNAREFPGWSDMKVQGGKLFVSSGEGPTVYRFGINQDGTLQEEGRLGFGNYTSFADMYQHVFVSDQKAYLLGEGGEYIIWNPTTLEINGSIKLPAFAPRGSIEAAPSLDRGMIVRDGRLYHAVAFSDAQNYRTAATSAIIVTDVTTDTIVETFDVNCPDLNVATVDSGNNLYFSNWVYSPGATLVYGDADACAVKIPTGQTTVDTAWTAVFKDFTGGHQAAVLTTLTSGRTLFSVFFEANQPFDPKKDDIFDWLFGANWKVFDVDLNARTSTELPGLDWNGGGFYTATSDDSDYLLIPGEGYQTTQVYKVPVNGPATLVLNTKGWATRMFQVK